ncbi:hypothetical protein B565_0711 [Aeromonas veronii B565]|nr:hypothetical protein B565_0711 [Aeromonas veronii B565]
MLRLYADSVVSSKRGWDSPAGGLWSQEGASNFSILALERVIATCGAYHWFQFLLLKE